MQRLLFLIPDLDYTGPARQLTLLATALPGEQYQREVVVLGPSGPLAEPLRRGGVAVESLGWRHVLDVRPFLRLRARIREQRPDVIHAWGLPALRVASFLHGRSKLVVSAPLPPRDGPPQLGWFDRRLVQRADRVVASGSSEAERLRRFGVSDHRITIIPPCVADRSKMDGEATVAGQRLGLPDDARLVVFLGPLDRHRGGHDAIWSFDMAAFMQPSLHLAIVGNGPDRPRLEKFARDLRDLDRVHFLGEQGDVTGLLRRADIVFAPEHGNGSTNAVLEAMAVGRPVLAWKQPHLMELIADGETGVLVRPGDKAALARQTKLLLEDDARRERLGNAARRRAVEQFGVTAMADRYAQLYSK